MRIFVKKPLWNPVSITVSVNMYELINNSSDCDNRPVCCILRCNAGTGTLCADDSAAAHIQCHMPAVTDNVAWLRFAVAHASAAASLCS